MNIPLNKTLIVFGVAIFFISTIVSSIIFVAKNENIQSRQLVCGNGIMEKEETEETCCEDVGCQENKTCQNNKCIAQQETRKLSCDACQYAEDYACKSYLCCSNADCDDNDSETKDMCSNPQSLYAVCKNTLATCDKTEYKMAFVIISTQDNPPSQLQIDTLGIIKNRFSIAFREATNDKGKMDTSYPIFTMQVDANMTDGSKKSTLSDWSIKFYENNPDKFDFISFYSAYDSPVSYIHHVTVNNYIDGIGYGSIDIDDISKYFGSRKLLGVNYMGKAIESLSFPLLTEGQRLIAQVNALLHETGHQWCCYVGEGIIQQDMHFYIGLACPYEVGCAMGSGRWVKNEYGSFDFSTRDISQTERYHPFQLYFMGILPETEYSVQFPVYDAGIVGQNFSLEGAIFHKNVSVNDIITIEGERSCL